MIRYPEHLEPVRFDDDAAAAAISACRAAIDDLVDTQRVRQVEATRAREEWRGRHRDVFDADFLALEREAVSIMHALQDLIAKIERARVEAMDENAQRARAREYYDEHVRDWTPTQSVRSGDSRPAH